MSTVRHILDAKGYRFWFVTPFDTLRDTLKRLSEKHIGALLVMDGERLVGIFSERDVVTLAEKMGGLPMEKPVGEVMTSQVYVVKLNTPVDECMALMTDRHIRHLPVMDEGMVVGLVSIGDIVKEALSDQEVVIKGLEGYIAVREFPT